MGTLFVILLSIVFVVLLAVIAPYVVAIPLAIVKALWLIISGHEHDPEVIVQKEAYKAKQAAKKKARTQRRRDFWGPLWFR